MSDHPLILLAHNIRSLWNIGSLFRSADVFGVSHIHLTGYTAAPPRKEITKTALGAEEWISWSKDPDPTSVIEQRRKEGFTIVALEVTKGSIPLCECTESIFRSNKTTKLCLIVGHEILGVPDELLRLSDVTVAIPMIGKKSSLNVSVAVGIALYHFRCCY